MKRSQKTNSLSIQESDFSKNPIFIGKSDLFLQSFLTLKKKYGEIKEQQNVNCFQNAKENFPSSRITRLIHRQINIKKNNTRHILPPLKNNKGTHNKEGKSMDFKTDRKQEILNIIGNIREKNDNSFQKSKIYEASFIDKKLISSHEFLNLIMIKKGYIS